MSAQNNDVELKFGADASEATRVTEDLGKAVKDSMGSIGEEFKAVQVLAYAFGEVLGNVMMKVADHISEMVKRAVKDYSELGDSVEHMQRRLGGTAESVSGLKIALESVGLSMSSFESVAQRLPQVLAKNGDRLKEAKVAYLDMNGEMLSSQQIIENIVSHLSKFEEGSARNAEGNRLLGRSYRQLADYVEMTKERTKEAQDVADEFGLVLAQRDVEAANEFGRSTRLLGSALEGFYVLVGKALTPALTGLANVMRDWLVPAYGLFRTTLEAVMGVLEGFWLGVRILGAALAALVAPLGLVVDLFGALWTGMTKGPAAGLAAVNTAVNGYKERMSSLLGWVVDETEKTNERMKNLTDRTKVDRSPQKGGGEDPMKHKGGDPISKAEAAVELAILKEQLAERMKALNDDHKEQLVMTEQFYAQKLTITMRGLEGEKKKLEADLAATQTEHMKNETREKSLAIEAKAIGIRGQLAVLEMKAADAVVASEREKSDAIEKLNNKRIESDIAFNKQKALIDVEAQKASLATQRELGDITAEQELVALRKLEDTKYAIELEALRKKLALQREWTDDFKRTQQQIELLALNHNKAMGKLSDSLAVEQSRDAQRAFTSIRGGFASAISGMLQGTMTFQKALQAVWHSIVRSFADAIGEMIAKWLFGESIKTTISRTFSLLRSALFGEEAVAATSAKVAEGTTVVSVNAAEAASGAAAAVAPTPFVGPGLAAAAFAATMALVLGAKSLFSAKGGFDIPSGTNPMTQLHEREMVLPAEQADVIRGMANQRTAGGENHFHIHTPDAAGVRRLFLSNTPALVDAMRRATRNFNTGIYRAERFGAR